MISHNPLEIKVKYLDKYISNLNQEYLKAQQSKNLPDMRGLNDLLISVYRIKVDIQLHHIQTPRKDIH